MLKGKGKLTIMDPLQRTQANRKDLQDSYSVFLPFNSSIDPFKEAFHFRYSSDWDHINTTLESNHLNLSAWRKIKCFSKFFGDYVRITCGLVPERSEGFGAKGANAAFVTKDSVKLIRLL